MARPAATHTPVRGKPRTVRRWDHAFLRETSKTQSFPTRATITEPRPSGVPGAGYDLGTVWQEPVQVTKSVPCARVSPVGPHR